MDNQESNITSAQELPYLDKLKTLIQELVLSNHKVVPVELLAKTVGKSVSLLYRSTNPNDNTPFQLAWLPAFMNLKDNYDLLFFICELTGHLPPAKLTLYNENEKANALEPIHMLRLVAKQLNTWAAQSQSGGWSTHQVIPMQEKAAEIYRLLDKLEYE